MRFIDKCIETYWGPEFNEHTLGSVDRMRSVLSLVAEEVEALAPEKSVAKICHLQCMEIAQHIRELSNEQA